MKYHLSRRQRKAIYAGTRLTIALPHPPGPVRDYVRWVLAMLDCPTRVLSARRGAVWVNAAKFTDENLAAYCGRITTTPELATLPLCVAVVLAEIGDAHGPLHDTIQWPLCLRLADGTELPPVEADHAAQAESHA